MKPRVIGGKCLGFAGYGQLCRSGIHRAVVVENTKDAFVCFFTYVGKTLDKVRGKFFCILYTFVIQPIDLGHIIA